MSNSFSLIQKDDDEDSKAVFQHQGFSGKGQMRFRISFREVQQRAGMV